MSPYESGPSKSPRPTLAPTTYSSSNSNIIVHHVTKDTCPQQLLEILYEEFEKELEIGRTYPQESPIGLEGFQNYFFQGDVFVGTICIAPETAQTTSSKVVMVPDGIEEARAGRDWEDCVAGSYYVRP